MIVTLPFFVSQEEKARVIQTLLFVAGINTLLQTFFGTRLPVVMGGSYTFVAPTISIILAGRYNDVADPREVLLPNRLVFL
jgi:nucleobase transporter 1/2